MNHPIISFSWNDSADFLMVSSDAVLISTKGKNIQVLFSNLVSFQVNTKKKLAPLIIGAVVTSLALVNILIKGSELSMIGVLCAGLLISYVGQSDYWVIKVERYDSSFSLWISKNKCPHFPIPLVNIVNFKITKGVFPPFYAHIKKERTTQIFSKALETEIINTPIHYYLLPPKPTPNYVLVKIDIAKLTKPLEFVIDKPYLALGGYKINNDAIINFEV